MDQNPYESPREFRIRIQKPRTWHAFAIAIGVVIGIVTAVALIDLLSYWVSLRLDPLLQDRRSGP